MLEYCLGRYDRAVELMRRSVDADPLSMIGPSYVARILFSAGRLAEAEAEIRATLVRSISPVREHALLALVLAAQGRTEQALAEARAESGDWARLWSLAIVEWMLGRKTESDAALAELEREHANSAAFQVAQVRAVRGELDAAFGWLERAFETRDTGVALAKVTPHLNFLHLDPRWSAFMRRIGLDVDTPSSHPRGGRSPD